MKKKDFASADILHAKLIVTALCAATFLICGCSNENEIEGTDTDVYVPVRVSAGIQTRAYNNLWEVNDAIGIYMMNGTEDDASNKKYISTATEETSSGTFSAAEGEVIYFPIDGSKRDFIAYYPYQQGVEKGSYVIDLSNQTPQKAIDLMRSGKVTGKHKDDASVNFQFEHKLVKIEVTIAPGTGLTKADLAGTKVSMTNQPLKGTFDLLTEAAEAKFDAITKDNPLKDISFCTVTDGEKFEAFVFPAESTANMEMRFIIPALNTTVPFIFAVNTAEKSQTFDAGKKYIYTININKIGVNVTSTIEGWVEVSDNIQIH